MSHVDDGILHAYLDGALDALSDAGELPDGMTGADVVSHLSMCADCHARLEAERAVQESAGAVLGDLPTPGHHAAGLPALDTTRPRRMRRVPLSWAASILLALGAGWMGSEVWRAQSSDTRGRADSGATVSTDAPVSTDATTFADATVSSEATASTDAPASADAPAPADAPASSDAMASSDGTVSRDARDTRMSSDALTEAMKSSPPVASAVAGAAVAAGAPRGADAAPQTAPLASTSNTRVTPIRDSVAARMRSASTAVEREDAAARRLARGVLAPLGQTFVAGDDTSGFPTRAGIRMDLLDERSRPSVRLYQRAAFDSIIAREQSGRIHFADASSSDLRALAGQVFVIRDAATASIEAAREPGQTVVRVRQMIPTTPAPSAPQVETEIELITWHQARVLLNEVAVAASQAEARSADEARAEGAANVVWPGISTLADGRREIILGTPDGSVWIALRARLGEDELRTLASRVTIR